MLAATLLLGLAGLTQAKTWYWGRLPDKSQPDAGQVGTNNCSAPSSSTTRCQTLIVNSATDFCLWGALNPSPPKRVGPNEETMVAYCLKANHGSRLMPAGTILSAHYIETPHFLQITGKINSKLIGIDGSDGGGELDHAGPNGVGNPIGGLVFSSKFGTSDAPRQSPKWHLFLEDGTYSLRVCRPGFGSDANFLCPHIYDEMGGSFNSNRARFGSGFDACKADDGPPPGLVNTRNPSQTSGDFSTWSRFTQGAAVTPAPYPPPPSSSCSSMSIKYTTYPTVKAAAASVKSSRPASSAKPSRSTSKPKSSTKATPKTSSKATPKPKKSSKATPKPSTSKKPAVKPTPTRRALGARLDADL